jgi:hypothetical protein
MLDVPRLHSQPVTDGLLDDGLFTDGLPRDGPLPSGLSVNVLRGAVHGLPSGIRETRRS